METDGLTQHSIKLDTDGNNVTIDDVLKLEPRAAAPTSPVEGMIYANSGNNNLYYYNGTAWNDLT